MLTVDSVAMTIFFCNDLKFWDSRSTAGRSWALRRQEVIKKNRLVAAPLDWFSFAEVLHGESSIASSQDCIRKLAIFELLLQIPASGGKGLGSDLNI